MSLLRLLALSYLASAVIFVGALALVVHPWHSRDRAQVPGPSARTVRENAPRPVLNRPEASAIVRLDLTPAAPVQPPQDARPWAHADVTPPQPRTVREPEQRPDEAVRPPSDVATSLPRLPQPPAPTRLASNEPPAAKPGFHIPDPPPLDAPIFSRGQIAATRLAAGLTPEMFRNFDLFIYVSKADAGPLSQRMYVFQKQRSGGLQLLYDWAASTGRERREVDRRGKRTVTTTPAGYYELDPDRMYPNYHSANWDQDMPNAMFFNWEREGRETGFAIHAATGPDIERLGSRASAGCVQLAPGNAAILYDLIHDHYRGQVPRFAYDYDSQTMSNLGQLMHDRAGKLKMADGYRVLVRIENYGGGDAVLF